MLVLIYTNKIPVNNMAQVNKTHKYILSKRAKIMKFLLTEGYSMTDIGLMFNIDKSGVSRILAAEKKYKGLVKEILK